MVVVVVDAHCNKWVCLIRILIIIGFRSKFQHLFNLNINFFYLNFRRLIDVNFGDFLIEKLTLRNKYLYMPHFAS